MRTLAIPGLLSLALALSMSAATLASGPGGGGGGGGPGSGGGGGGGGGGKTNPFPGTWGTHSEQIGSDFFRWEFTFTRDFNFTFAEVDLTTGEILTSYSGTYVLGGVGKDGFPLITMFSGGQILFQEEYSAAAEGMALRGTINVIIGRL